MSVRYFVIFLGLLTLVSLPTIKAAADMSDSDARFPQPAFWEKKDKIYQRMLDQRSIFVSVNSEENPSKAQQKTHQLKILGAGIVFRSANETWKHLIRFDQWSSIHEAIKESRWTPSNQRLFLHMAAFDYHAKMIMRVRMEKKKSTSFIYMQVVQGSFQGMRVALRIKDAKSRKAEVAVAAQYDYVKLPMPQFFVEFGLEVVFQKIAEKMRSYIEDPS